MAGVVLLSIGTLGVTRRLGSISRAGFFHPPYWINWFHLALGAVVSGTRIAGSAKMQARTTLVATFMGTILGLLGLLFGPAAARRYEIPELADPSDHIAHLGVGLIAWWAWRHRLAFASPAPASITLPSS